MVRIYSAEYKLKVVKIIFEDGISKHEIQRTFNLDRHTQINWLNKYENDGDAKFCYNCVQKLI